MSELSKSGGNITAAYQFERWRTTALTQRSLLLAAGALYGVAALWLSFRIGTDAAFATVSLGLVAVTLLLYALTYLSEPRIRLEIVPALFALTYGAHILLGLAYAPLDGTLRFPILFSLLGIFILALAPALRGALIALSVAAAVGLYGGLVFLPAQGRFIPVEALLYSAPSFVVIFMVALALETARRGAFVLQGELARRATSDEITGVSNHAHINILAQNEFARARRYGEPCACLILEIDHYELLRDKRGPAACNVVMQVLAGYCVVVMRHCDSFGRLGPARFLALLPETRGAGALTLAARMCRDIAALDVAHAGGKINFTISIGAAEMHAADRWAGDLLRRAEQGLNDAIEQGRGQAVLASPALVLEESALETL